MSDNFKLNFLRLKDPFLQLDPYKIALVKTCSGLTFFSIFQPYSPTFAAFTTPKRGVWRVATTMATTLNPGDCAGLHLLSRG